MRVSSLLRLVATDFALELPKDVNTRSLEERFDAVVQNGLIALHGQDQDVVGLCGNDVASDLGLAAHRVDRQQIDGKLEHLQQLRDRGDLVALLINHHLAQRDAIPRGPRADHVYRRLAAGRIEAVLSLNDRVRSFSPHSSLGGTHLLAVDRRDHRVESIVHAMLRLSCRNFANLFLCPHSATDTKSSAADTARSSTVVPIDHLPSPAVSQLRERILDGNTLALGNVAHRSTSAICSPSTQPR